ncbi:MAG: ATP-binding protein [Tissierellia bacterium]|nr:ATP-binding protein [Tissierellia bacterium]
MAYYYTGKLISDLEEINTAIKSVLCKLDNLISDENLLFDIRIIINELMINGYEHGNCYDTQKHLDLRLAINESRIRIQVVDEGNGINYDCFKYNPYSMKTTGRGLKIVKELSDELIINNNSITAIINK